MCKDYAFNASSTGAITCFWCRLNCDSWTRGLSSPAVGEKLRLHVVEDPLRVGSHSRVDSGQVGGSALLVPEGDDADDVVLGLSVHTRHLHQRSSAVSSAGILAHGSSGADLIVVDGGDVGVQFLAPSMVGHLQADDFQNFARLVDGCEGYGNVK